MYDGFGRALELLVLRLNVGERKRFRRRVEVENAVDCSLRQERPELTSPSFLAPIGDIHLVFHQLSSIIGASVSSQ